ncbi:MAG: hypothetical protein AB7L13_06985 [Acidimicrobiia bacterium]
MRFVEVKPEIGSDKARPVLRLHPRLTVVHASADERLRLVRAITETMQGRRASSGLVNCRGVLLDFDDATLQLLSIPPTTPMVVEPGDLPLPPPSPARVRRDRLEQDLAELDQLTADAAAALTEARQARAKAEADLHGARLDIEAALAAQAAVDRAAYPETADDTGALDPLSIGSGDPSTIGAARRTRVAAELADARAAHDSAVRALHGLASSSDASAAAALESLLARRSDLVEQLAGIELVDAEQVRAALALYENLAQSAGAADPRRAKLLTRWRDLSARIVALPPVKNRANPQLIAMAKARVRAAERALEDARTAARSLRDPSIRLAVERAHEAVEKAEAAASKSRSRATAREKYDQARQAEAALLAEYGLTSYSDFLVATVTRPDEHEAAAQIAAAEAEFARTQAMLAAAREVEPATAERTELEAERDSLRAEIADYLGADPGGEVEQALASVNDPRFLEAREQLARLLRMHGVGIEGPEYLEPGRRFVATADAANALRKRLTDELITIDAGLAADGSEPWRLALAAAKDAQRRVDELHVELRTLQPIGEFKAPLPEELVATLLPPPSVLSELEAAAGRADEERRRRLAEAHEERARAAEPQLRPFRDRLHAAIAVEQRAAAYLNQLEERALTLSSSLVDAIEDEEADGVDESLLLPQPELRDIEFAVLGKLSAVRNAYFGGPVPLIFDDAFRGVPSAQRVGLLALVDRLADNTQVIYLSDDAETLVWGERQSTARVSVTSI